MVVSLFSNILRVLQPRLEDEQIIPVMDGFQHVGLLAGSSKAMTVMRQTNLRRSMTFSHSENLIGEVLFADSKYSVFTQVADIVGCLRLVRDLDSEGLPLAPFKQRLLPIARRLDDNFDYEDVAVITLNDVPQIPRHRARAEA